MQEIAKNRVPCEELIKEVIAKLGTYEYVTRIGIEAFLNSVSHWVELRRLDKPAALDGRDTTRLSPVTIEIDNQYWWSASYAKQLIIVQCLPHLLEKCIKQVREACLDPGTVTFNPVTPVVKRPWWKSWTRNHTRL
jgi:hypothetical protein